MFHPVESFLSPVVAPLIIGNECCPHQEKIKLTHDNLLKYDENENENKNKKKEYSLSPKLNHHLLIMTSICL